jgi:hypothetical protein
MSLIVNGKTDKYKKNPDSIEPGFFAVIEGYYLTTNLAVVV